MESVLNEVLALLGERWTLLLVREVALGVRRFEELVAALGTPRSLLAQRLRQLVAAGIVEPRTYRVPGGRPRCEYVLTGAGFDLLPALAALSDWGDKHLAHRGDRDVTYCHSGCGQHVVAQLVCVCGQPTDPRTDLIASVTRVAAAPARTWRDGLDGT